MSEGPACSSMRREKEQKERRNRKKHRKKGRKEKKKICREEGKGEIKERDRMGDEIIKIRQHYLSTSKPLEEQKTSRFAGREVKRMVSDNGISVVPRLDNISTPPHTAHSVTSLASGCAKPTPTSELWHLLFPILIKFFLQTSALVTHPLPYSSLYSLKC